MSNCWPLEEHRYADVFAVSASFKTDDPPLWNGLFTPSARAAAPRENRGHCLSCHEDTHSVRSCRLPFINASGCLNPELGQLGDDDAYRRWQARMTSYRRDGENSRSHTHNKNRRNRSNQLRGHRQDHSQVNSHSGNHSHCGNHSSPYPPGPTWWCPTLACLFGSRDYPGEALRGNPQSGREPQRAPMGYLSHGQLTARRRNGTPGPSTDGTVRDTSFGFAACSRTCCSPVKQRRTHSFS